MLPLLEHLLEILILLIVEIGRFRLGVVLVLVVLMGLLMVLRCLAAALVTVLR